jgi:hypothetical protein
MSCLKPLGLVFLLATALPLGPAPPAQRQKDPQSTYEPRSEPGVGQRFLAKFVGDWDVVKTFYPRSGEPVRTKGECRQAMIHAGRFLESKFVFGEGAARTTGLGLVGFEPASGKFTSVWTDSRSTRLSLRHSRDKFDGAQIVLYSSTLDGGKAARTSRTVTRLEEDGRKIVHRQYTAGADGQERLVMELMLTRKAGTPRRP